MTRRKKLALWLGVAMLIVVGPALALTGDTTAVRLSGLVWTIALALWCLALRTPRGTLTPPRWRDGVVLLPRRVSAEVLLGIVMLLMGPVFFTIATRAVEGDSVRTPKQSAGVLLALLGGPCLVLLGLVWLLALARGRGRLGFSAIGVDYVPVIGRAQRPPWDTIREVTLDNRARALIIRLPHGPVIVPMRGQRWPGAEIESLLRHYADAGASYRAALAHPSVLDSLPPAGRPRRHQFG